MKSKVFILSVLILATCSFVSCEKDCEKCISVIESGCISQEEHYHMEERGNCVFFEGHFGEDFDSALDSVARMSKIKLSDPALVIEKDTVHMKPDKNLDTQHRVFIYVFLHYPKHWADPRIIDSAGDVYWVEMRD